MDWLILWISKIDYIADYYMKIKGKYEIVDESIDYYMTLSEAALFYLKEYNNYYGDSYVQHKLILKNKFFDRLFLKEDFKERDFAEYIKYLFFYKDSDINYVYNLIKNNIGIFNYELVIARLLFPSYYFYYLEKVVVEGEDFEELKKIVKRTNEYEKYLMGIVNIINQYSTKKIILPF